MCRGLTSAEARGMNPIITNRPTACPWRAKQQQEKPGLGKENAILFARKWHIRGKYFLLFSHYDS
jgi:hypothetical protein